MSPKPKTAMELRLENMERSIKRAESKLKSAREKWRAVGDMGRKRAR